MFTINPRPGQPEPTQQDLYFFKKCCNVGYVLFIVVVPFSEPHLDHLSPTQVFTEQQERVQM